MIEVTNLTKEFIEERDFIKIGKNILSMEDRECFYFSLVFVEEDKMAELNLEHRGKEGSTDVLSFEEALPYDNYIGDIIICPKTVRENAEEFGREYSEELLEVFIHGILHLLGYDHGDNFEAATEMASKQREYTQKMLSLLTD